MNRNNNNNKNREVMFDDIETPHGRLNDDLEDGDDDNMQNMNIWHGKKNKGCKKLTKRNTIKVDIKKTTIELFLQDLCLCLLFFDVFCFFCFFCFCFCFSLRTLRSTLLSTLLAVCVIVVILSFVCATCAIVFFNVNTTKTSR